MWSATLLLNIAIPIYFSHGWNEFRVFAINWFVHCARPAIGFKGNVHTQPDPIRGTANASAVFNHVFVIIAISLDAYQSLVERIR